MIYAVDMTPTAESDLAGAFAYIYARAPQNAIQWLKDIYEAIDSLEEFPNRCPIAPDSENLGETVRHYIFKSHRVIFFVDEPLKTVRILYVRHAKMRAVGEPEGDDE